MASLPYPRSQPNYLPTEPTEPTEVSGEEEPPTDCTNVHRLGGYGIPAIPTQTPNYLPTEATETTEVSGARYSPTDFADVHRLGGYGILPYPRSHQTIFPQKPQKPQNFLTQDILRQKLLCVPWIPWENPKQPNHLCASVRICGRLFYARSFCEFREFRGRTLSSLT